MPVARGEEIRFEGSGGLGLSGTLAAGETGDGVLLLHGLTGHRGLVTMGSRLLEKSGRTTFAWDARGHGVSDAPPDGSGWSYGHLAADALTALDVAGLVRPVLVGVSMGAHTAARVALARPDLVGGLVLVTPAFDPEVPLGAAAGRWDRLADALERDGLEGFADEVSSAVADPAVRTTVHRAALQRMAVHRDPRCLITALREVPRSRPFGSWAELSGISCPSIVIGSRDETDPTHPLAVARKWSEVIAGASLEVEKKGESPLAWRGAAIAGAAALLASG